MRYLLAELKRFAEEIEQAEEGVCTISSSLMNAY
jgi:hypothetical protein